jgi:general secretion pathway protein L
LKRRQKKKKSKKKMLAAALAVCMLGLIVTYFVNNRRQMDLRYNVLNQQLQELKLQVQSIEGLQSDAERIKKFSGAIGKIKKTDISKIKLLEELTSIIPEDSWLTEFRYKVNERKVKLSGYAVSASKLIPILEESNMFEKVKFTSPITTEKGRDRERFRLEMIVTIGKNK